MSDGHKGFYEQRRLGNATPHPTSNGVNSAGLEYVKRDYTTGCPTFDKIAARVDPVNHPAHYTSHPSGIEAIQITRHMTFNLGNAIKYVWRAGLKTSDAVEDLRKAVFYINDEIKRLQGQA